MISKKYLLNGSVIVKSFKAQKDCDDFNASNDNFVQVDDNYVASESEEQLSSQAQSEMKTELEWVDIQLKYNASGDADRSKFTNEVLYAYAIACRDYVQNIDGVLTIVGDKPTRPTAE